MGIVFDEINVPHELRVGIPQTSENLWDSGEPVFKQQGVYTFDLAQFPANNLPSGGGSLRVSPSEMVLVYLKAQNYEPRNDSTRFTFYKDYDTINQKQLYSYVGADFREDPSWTWYWSYDYSFIGRFDWEINSPGNYSVLIQTAWGSALIDFTVVDSSSLIEPYLPEPLLPPQLPLPPPPDPDVQFPPDLSQPPPGTEGTCPKGPYYRRLPLFGCDEGYSSPQDTGGLWGWVGTGICYCDSDPAAQEKKKKAETPEWKEDEAGSTGLGQLVKLTEMLPTLIFLAIAVSILGLFKR